MGDTGFTQPLTANGGDDHDKKRDWFTPKRLLGLFCAISMINYIDRGAIASNGVNGSPAESGCQPGATCHAGTGIQGEFALSNFQDGLLPAAFMVGLLAACPIFAELSKTRSPFRLIGCGMSVWAVAVIGCGFSQGLASFISLAAPCIADHAPPGRTGRWLSIFYMCLPVGYALGYVYGGVIASVWSWRGAFFLEGLVMLPFGVFGFVANPGGEPRVTRVSLLGQQVAFPPTTAGGLLADVGVLLTNKIFVVNTIGYMLYTFVLDSGANACHAHVECTCKPGPIALVSNRCCIFAGYTLYTFVIGAYAYWGPKATKALFHLDSADTIFGGITVLTGIGGTVFGGLLLDHVGATIRNAFILQGVVTLVGALLCLAAFLANSLTHFVFFLALGEFFLFAIQGPANKPASAKRRRLLHCTPFARGPANIISLECAPPELRALAIALSTVFCHLLGDDAANNWHVSMGSFTALLFPGAAIWAAGALFKAPNLGSSLPPLDVSGTDVETPDRPGEIQQEAPLLSRPVESL
eukprot:jgi/Mesen1/777/ME000110S_11044